MIYEIIKQTIQEFDKKFGKAGPEKNGYSIGRKAGCDDCFTNVELRKEHRAFLISTIFKILENFSDEMTEEQRELKEELIKIYKNDSYRW